MIPLFLNDNNKQKNIINIELDEIQSYLNESVDDDYKYFMIDDEYIADNKEIQLKDGKLLFYPSIKNALMVFENINKGRELFVHVPIEGQKIKASKSKEPSAAITGELIFKEPTKVKCIGKIRIGNELKTYEYKGGKLKSWSYSWLSSQDKNVINDPKAEKEDQEFQEKLDKENTNEVFSYDVNKALIELEGAINTSDKLILFNEDAKNDKILRNYLYKQRMRNRKEVITLYDQVKIDNKFIRFTFPDIKKYQKRNLYIDTYFYTQLFFENNKWTLRKGINLFFDFMTRLLKQADLSSYGYSKNTVFIPIHQWDINNDGTVWNYRVSLNPMSIIYYFMFNGSINQLKKVFKDINLVFIGYKKFFKFNFSELDEKDSKK